MSVKLTFYSNIPSTFSGESSVVSCGINNFVRMLRNIKHMLCFTNACSNSRGLPAVVFSAFRFRKNDRFVFFAHISAKCGRRWTGYIGRLFV